MAAGQIGHGYKPLAQVRQLPWLSKTTIQGIEGEESHNREDGQNIFSKKSLNFKKVSENKIYFREKEFRQIFQAFEASSKFE